MSTMAKIGMGFAAAIGLAGIIAGVVQREPGFIVIGAAFAVAAGFLLIVGFTATPGARLSSDSVSGTATFDRLPEWATFTAGGIAAAGCIVGGILLAL